MRTIQNYFPVGWTLAIGLLSLSSAIAQSIPDNWHQWRGPNNNGVSDTAKPPLTWSEKQNVKWKTALEGAGVSSPIVWGDKVFLLSARNTGNIDPSKPKPEDQPERVFGIKHPNTSYEMLVSCFDRNTGETLWQEVAKTLVPHEGHHKDASFASASPFCDGERLYCWFGSGGLFTYSLDGKKLWQRDLGKAKVGASLGEGSSPVVKNGKLVLVRDFDRGQSSIEVLDAKSGKTLWKKDRDEKNAWATPAIVDRDGVTQVITSASKQVRSYNLDTGEIIWFASGLTSNCTPCPIVDGDVVYCMSGYKGHSLLAIPITGKGDVSDQIIWKSDRGTPYVPSALLYRDQLYYTQSNQGILTSRSAKDGTEKISRSRVPELGDIYASPVAADGKIYLLGRRGSTVVIAPGNELKVLASNELEDNFHASPALAGKNIVLRGMRFLYCLEDGAKLSENVQPAPKPEEKLPPKKALGAKLKSMVDAGKITNEESLELYLTAFPQEEDNANKWLAGLMKDKSTRQLLETIAKRELPNDYEGANHQAFVDKWFKTAGSKGAEVGRLWKEQQRLFPEMKNKGASFIKILDYVRTQR